MGFGLSGARPRVTASPAREESAGAAAAAALCIKGYTELVRVAGVTRGVTVDCQLSRVNSANRRKMSLHQEVNRLMDETKTSHAA